MLRRACNILLLIAVIGSFAFAGGCQPGNTDNGASKAFQAFFENIQARKFEQAYGYVALSVSVSAERFVKAYTQFFDSLEISSITISDESVESFGERTQQCTYTLCYHGAYCEVADTYKITMVRNLDGDWKLSWTPQHIIPEMTLYDRVVVTYPKAQRGEIFASDKCLAMNIAMLNISVEVPSDIAPEKLTDTATRVAGVLGVDADRLLEKMTEGKGTTVFVTEIYPTKLTDDMRSSLLAVDNVTIAESYASKSRYYPYHSMLAHIIGYIQTAEEKDLAALNDGRTSVDGLYTTSSLTGKLGLESEYERELRGTDGMKIYLLSDSGQNKRTFFSNEAEDGLDIQLTVDLDTQLLAEQLLYEAIGTDNKLAGAVVVMNPLTGAVDAIASYPTIDLNSFIIGMTQEEYAALSGGNSPFFNRAVKATYPPGSTYKTITAAAALHYKVLNSGYVFDGVIEKDYWTPTGYGAWYWPAIKRVSVSHRAEPLNMRNALLNSDNIYFANAALMLGDDRMREYWNALGLNEPIDFEIPVSSAQYSSEGEERDYKLVADSGYGQGRMLVSPLQMAATYCAFANGGDIVTPYIVKGLYSSNGMDYTPVMETEVRYWRENVFSQEICSTLVPMLRDVVDPDCNGTGRKLLVESCTTAGKTGTAEIGSNKSREISWFVGFRVDIPDSQERLVLVVLEVPSGTEYSELKYSIARSLLELQPDD